jgi:hypothetical protein
MSDKSSKGKEDETSIIGDHVHGLDSNRLWADVFGRDGGESG